MFRVHFDPRIAEWVIQFWTWGLFWTTVRNTNGVLHFPFLEDAELFVTETGLNKAYDRWTAKGLNQKYVLGTLQQG